MYEELQSGIYESSFCMKEDFLIEEANTGNADAMYLLAKLYWKDDQIDKAFNWFTKASEKNQADATYCLGNFYCHPTGWGVVESSNENAFLCYAKAAELGSALAIYELGYQYLQGIIVEKDTEKAIELLNKAAELEVPEAYWWLAKCFEYGTGVEKDMKKALKFAYQAYSLLQDENEINQI